MFLADQADSPAEEQAIKILADWDFEDHKDEAGPLIFHTMLKKIEENYTLMKFLKKYDQCSREWAKQQTN